MPSQVPSEIVEHTTLGTSFLPGLDSELPPGGGGGGGGGPPNPGMGGGGGGGPDMVFVERVRQIGSLDVRKFGGDGAAAIERTRKTGCDQVPLNDN
jgi:hypothetical protein